MNKLLLISISFLLSQIATAQLRKAETFYDKEKKIIREVYYVRMTSPPAIEGLYTGFYPNGKVKNKGNYVNNVQNGIWEYFYDNGSPKMTGIVENNLRTGFWKYYSENGRISSMGNLKNGIRDGAWKFYYPNEELRSEGELVSGRKYGLWQYYYEDGTPKAKAHFVNDTGLYTEFGKDGKKRMEGWIVNGQSDSTWTYFYENGKPQAAGKEKSGLKTGGWQLFHPSGNLAAAGNYKEGIPDGKWTYYHENGKISAEGTEKKGQKEGIWKLYYPNGSFRAEGEFASGTGPYQEFYESGKLKAKGQLAGGKNEGSWKYFYEDGNLEGQAAFRSGEGDYRGFYPDGTLKMKGSIRDGKRTGTWEIFNPDGTTAGFHKHYEPENTQPGMMSLPEEKELLPNDTLRNQPVPANVNPPAVNPPRNPVKPGTLPSARMHRKLRLRYFTPKVNEYKSLIVSTNPLALLYNQLPVSAEYYIRERLGHELTVTLLRNPFFSNTSQIPLNQIYSRGFSVHLRQKFYHTDSNMGMWYFGHELRYTDLTHAATVFDVELALNRTLTRNENKYEYSLLLGDRWMQHPGSKGFTMDIFGGIGIGYRSSENKFDPKPAFQVIFESLPDRSLTLPFRLGLNVGYVF
jgi:uncharacterized protein